MWYILTIKLLLLLLLLPKVVTGLGCDNKILEFLNFDIDTFGKYNTQKRLLLLYFYFVFVGCCYYTTLEEEKATGASFLEYFYYFSPEEYQNWGTLTLVMIKYPACVWARLMGGYLPCWQPETNKIAFIISINWRVGVLIDVLLSTPSQSYISSIQHPQR